MTMIATRTCRKCAVTKPETREFFAPGVNYRNYGGLDNTCRDCRNEANRRKWAEKQAALGKPEVKPGDLVKNVVGDASQTRQCKSCREDKPLTTQFFSPHEAGFRHVCRACTIERKKGLRAPEQRSRIHGGRAERKCTKCELWKPEDEDHFHAHAKSRGGLEAACRACRRAEGKQRRDARPEAVERQEARQVAKQTAEAAMKSCADCGVSYPHWEGHYYAAESARCIPCQQKIDGELWAVKYGDRTILDPNEPLKKCTTCSTVWPRSAEYFHRSAKLYDGLQSHCKACQQIRRRQHYLENIETNREASKLRWINMPLEEKMQRRLNKRGGNRGKSADPYKTAANNHNARARRLGAPGRVTADELRGLREAQGNCCHYCTRPLTPIRNPQADHLIPITRAELNPTGDITNFAWACGRCNHFKNDKTPDEWTSRWYENPAILLAEAELERLLEESAHD